MKYYLAIFILLFAADAFSQKFVYEGFPKNTNNYEKKIIRKVKRLSCYDKNEDYSMFFIYHLKATGNNLSLGNSSEILSNLEFIYPNRKCSMPSNAAIIYTASLEVVAYSDDLQVTCNFGYPAYQRLINYVLNNETEYLFRISGSNGMVYFALKDNNLQVLVIEQNSLKIFPFTEFVDCCWDTLRL